MRFAALMFGIFCLSSMSYAYSGEKSLDDEFDMAVSKVDWVRSKYLIESLSGHSNEFLSDCALSFHLAIDFGRDSQDEDVLAKANNSRLVYASASTFVAEVTEFESGVFRTEDHLDYMGAVIEKMGECEKVLQPLYREFSSKLNKTVAK